MEQTYKLKIFQSKKLFIVVFFALLFLLIVAVSPVIIQQFSKVKGNIKSDEFVDWTDDRVKITYDTTGNTILREKLKKELKARGLRNKQKRK